VPDDRGWVAVVDLAGNKKTLSGEWEAEDGLAWSRSGNQLSVEFDRAVWAYCVEPFIMRELQTNAFGYRASKLLELLLCAVGSPPENRRFLKVGQKDCCLAVRNMIWQRWHDKLHHLPSTIDEAAAAIASFNEMRGGQCALSLGWHQRLLPPAVPAPEPQPSAMPEDTAMSLAGGADAAMGRHRNHVLE